MFSGYLGLMNLTLPNVSSQSKYKIPLNQLLYRIYENNTLKTKCYKDIIGGTNDSVAGTVGLYDCTVGFDMVTGMGSINGINLYNALKSIGASPTIVSNSSIHDDDNTTNHNNNNNNINVNTNNDNNDNNDINVNINNDNNDKKKYCKHHKYRKYYICVSHKPMLKCSKHHKKHY